MGTTATANPRTDESTETLVRYHVEDGLAVIELNDPPANTRR